MGTARWQPGVTEVEGESDQIRLSGASHFFRGPSLGKRKACFELTQKSRKPEALRYLHRDRRLDRGMRVVVGKGEIFELEVVDVFHRGVELHAWQRTELAGELFAGLVEVVLVKV